MKFGQKVHMMMSYLLLMTFLNIRIQALQHQRKKCVDHKGTMLKNKPNLVTFPESILVSLWTFQPTLIYCSVKLMLQKELSYFTSIKLLILLNKITQYTKKFFNEFLFMHAEKVCVCWFLQCFNTNVFLHGASM